MIRLAVLHDLDELRVELGNTRICPILHLCDTPVMAYLSKIDILNLAETNSVYHFIIIYFICKILWILKLSGKAY